jgi:hypothetical protein
MTDAALCTAAIRQQFTGLSDQHWLASMLYFREPLTRDQPLLFALLQDRLRSKPRPAGELQALEDLLRSLGLPQWEPRLRSATTLRNHFNQEGFHHARAHA